MLGRGLMDIQTTDTDLEAMTTPDDTTTLRRSLKGTIPVDPVAAAHIVIGTATDASTPVTADSSQPAAVWQLWRAASVHSPRGPSRTRSQAANAGEPVIGIFRVWLALSARACMARTLRRPCRSVFGRRKPHPVGQRRHPVSFRAANPMTSALGSAPTRGRTPSTTAPLQRQW